MNKAAHGNFLKASQTSSGAGPEKSNGADEGLEVKAYEERLRELSHLAWRRVREDLITPYN